jgi:hypothetical protein
VLEEIPFDSVTIGSAEPLVAEHPTWASQPEVAKMGG